MPFAMVLGEPLTEMPRDLYIPPQAMEVFLDAFEGPLDLLLYLIRRQNLNILDIPIAEITRQYMQYIELMSELQLDLAGEYLVMAATLAEIKSRMLLPRAAPPGDGTGRGSARRAGAPAAGIRALQAGRAGPGLTAAPGARHLDGQRRVQRPARGAGAAGYHAEGNAARVQGRGDARGDVRASPYPARAAVGARAHERHPRQPCRRTSSSDFSRLFLPEEGRMGVAVTFIAILELLREGLIEIVQNEAYAPIHSVPRDPARAAGT